MEIEEMPENPVNAEEEVAENPVIAEEISIEKQTK